MSNNVSVAEPFEINVPEEQLSWIVDRVKSFRLPQVRDAPQGQDWEWGMSRAELVKIQSYWTERYDWRSVERQLNSDLQMFTMPVNHHDQEVKLHFVHHRSDRPDAVPLLFIHGWPGNFLEVKKVIEPLTSPSDSKAQAFHIIAPSLPGYGFSSYPSQPCSPMDMAALLNQLMQELGYSTYIVQGGDWGSMIGRMVAIKFPKSCVGLHLNMVVATPPSPLWHPIQVGRLALAWLTGGRNLTAFENRMLKRIQWWLKDESGYQAIQSTKPHTIGFALADSPVGMMCWIRDKLQSLTGPDYHFTEEEVITWTMIYILNGSPGHAEIYTWSAGERMKEFESALFNRIIDETVAVGISNFPYDVMFAPRWWAECKVAKNVVFWKDHDRGGHFATVEVPGLMVEDIRAFTGNIAPDVLTRLRKSSA